MAFALDTSTVISAIGVALSAVALVGVAKLGVDAAILAFQFVQDAIDGGGAAAAVSSGGGIEAVYARAAAMAAAGEGQSEDFRHNTVTAAYDAGYSGRRLGDSVDPATLEAWKQGAAHRAEDSQRGMGKA